MEFGLVMISINQENQIIIKTNNPLSESITDELTKVTSEFSEKEEAYIYSFPLFLYNAFVIYSLKFKIGEWLHFEDDSLEIIKSYAMQVVRPEAFLQNDKWIGFNIPSLPAYQKLLTLMGAKNNRFTLWTVTLGRAYEIYRLLSIWTHPFLPRIRIMPDLKQQLEEQLRNKTSIDDLFEVKLTELNTIKSGYRVKTEGFAKLKYDKAKDLLLKKPVRYIDRQTLFTYNNAPWGQSFHLKGKIESITKTVNRDLIIDINDGYETHTLNKFGGGWLTQLFSVGDTIIVELSRRGRNNFNLLNLITEYEAKALPILPVYKQSPTNGITTKLLTNSTQELLLRFDGSHIFDYIEGAPKKFWKAIEDLHFPESVLGYEQTINSLAFYELVLLQALFIDKKKNTIKSSGLAKKTDNPVYMNQALEAFKFTPTKGQENAIKEIIKRLNSDSASDILLSGDVGSGKSLVANSACLYTVDSGFQAALIGPTEILAQQLYNGLMEQIKDLSPKPRVAYLSSATKAKEKKDTLKMIADGYIDIVVGTHSLFNIEYANLGLVVIDEQQKFGREQREKLIHSRKDGKLVDLLAQTATPIPQSTALAFYGDIDLISLTEKPGGRKENITKWVKKSSDAFLKEITSQEWTHVFNEIKAGRQVFIVTPAVETSAKTANVKSTTKILQDKFPNLIIDNIHGGLTKESQNKKIEKFRDNKTNVLIASSIVEVGIDIPNASIILILDADRFGASSLHQIRGRVGRSDHQGYCYLIAEEKNGNSAKRLQSLVDSNDGFEIALVDLETRNSGDLLGNQQSGESNLMFCNLADHTKLITEAQLEAERLYNSEYRDMLLNNAKTFLEKDEE